MKKSEKPLFSCKNYDKYQIFSKMYGELNLPQKKSHMQVEFSRLLRLFEGNHIQNFPSKSVFQVEKDEASKGVEYWHGVRVILSVLGSVPTVLQSAYRHKGVIVGTDGACIAMQRGNVVSLGI